MLMSRVLLKVSILSHFQYFASIIDMARENFMPPPLLFRYFRLSQMALSFIEISHKSSTHFQKFSQSFTLKRITFSSKIIMQSKCIPVGNRKLTELRAGLNSGVYHHLPYFFIMCTLHFSSYAGRH